MDIKRFSARKIELVKLKPILPCSMDGWEGGPIWKTPKTQKSSREGELELIFKLCRLLLTENP